MSMSIPSEVPYIPGGDRQAVRLGCPGNESVPDIDGPPRESRLRAELGCPSDAGLVQGKQPVAKGGEDIRLQGAQR